LPVPFPVDLWYDEFDFRRFRSSDALRCSKFEMTALSSKREALGAEPDSSTLVDNERGKLFMPTANVKAIAESSKDKLKTAIVELEKFLNGHALPQLTNEESSEESIAVHAGLLSDLRHLLVFSEVAYEKLGAILRRPNFDLELAERTLYEVYHHCVNAFFYPKNEGYSEDGRYAYTGQDAIRFRAKPVRAVRDVVLNISRVYEELRDDLSYYESEYLTQRRMLGQSK